jgi:hypothetical protein
LPDWVAVAAALMIGMALLAIGARNVTLWGVIELKMELLIQGVDLRVAVSARSG